MAKLRRKSTPTTKSAPSKAKVKAAPAKAKAARSGPAKPKAKPVGGSRPAEARPAHRAPGKTPKVPKAPQQASRARLQPASEAPPPVRPTARAKPAPAQPAPPPRRSTYIDAVALYEKGVQFLQARRFKEAAETLRGVIVQFPEEKELHERARLYILVCDRAIAAEPPHQESPEDRVFAATLAINNGSLDLAIAQLSGVLQKDPEHDHACYMLGVAHALKGHYDLALQHLARSMALNPENRDLVAKEPDLEVLRRTEEMKALLASPPAPLLRKDRAGAPRSRRSS